MTTNLSQLIDTFPALNVLVLGDAMLDSYLEGVAGTLCREAPVPVVAVTKRADAPGGAANTAANVRGLGGQVALLSVIGADPEGAQLLGALAERGVDTANLLQRPARRTLAKHRVIADSQILVRFDQGSTGPLDPQTEGELIRRLTDLFPRCDALIISDYGYGILTARMIAAIAELQSRTPRVIVADSKCLVAYREVGLTAIKPNYAEAIQLLGVQPQLDQPARAETIAGQADRLLALTGAQIAAVTLDTDGAVAIQRGGAAYRTYARPTRHANAAGAGDTFLGALALALAAGADTPAAAELASAAAAVVVGQPGTVTCSAVELRASIAIEGKHAADLSGLVALLDRHRQQGRRIVFTNGCFDILHSGHVTYLSRAKALGDLLVVGINSDASVRRLKGPSRPINTLEDRAQILAALSCVDYLIAFDDQTPIALLRAIRPDVFVKGGDYTRATLPEAPVVEALGGVVQILQYLPDQSTTKVIERIRASMAATACPAGLLEQALGEG